MVSLSQINSRGMLNPTIWSTDLYYDIKNSSCFLAQEGEPLYAHLGRKKSNAPNRLTTHKYETNLFQTRVLLENRV